MAKNQATKLESKIFNSDVNKEVLALYVRVYGLNQRQGTVKTKTRAEVSGGGKKPYKQKGTGRSQAGSTRAADWVHGGIAHGPKPKDWTGVLNAKVKKLALISALSLRAGQSKVTVTDIPSKVVKTKEVAAWIKENNLEGTTLIITPAYNQDFFKAARNITGVKVASADNVNPHEVLWAKNLVMSDDAVKNLEKRV